MQIEVDQSGKIEHTEINTVIALSNNKQASILLHRRIKRELQQYFRAASKYRVFPYLAFAACVAFVVKESNVQRGIVIDREYFGHEPYIKQHILLYLRRLKVKHAPPIRFALVGKSSPAHKLARRVGRNLIAPTKIITEEEMLRLMTQ